MNRILSKILVIGAGIAAAASVASCDLTTESPSNFNEMNLFSDPTLTEYQLYSVYNIFGGTNAHRGRYLPWYGYNTDIEWFISSDRGDKSQIAMYDIRVTNTQLNQDNGPYNELYSGIERVNLTINGIRKYGDPQERPEMAALLGEALTLRAVLYAELLKAFGEVPARFEPVTPDDISQQVRQGCHLQAVARRPRRSLQLYGMAGAECGYIHYRPCEPCLGERPLRPSRPHGLRTGTKTG